MEGMDSVTSGRDNNQEAQELKNALDSAMQGIEDLINSGPAQDMAPLASPIMTMGEIVEAEGGQGLVQSDTDARLGRLIDHVNREIGVAQDTPLHMRLDKLEKLLARTIEKINDKTTLLK